MAKLPIMAMNVSLTKALEAFVNEKVASGRYGSASEVVREALRLLEHRERLREAQLSELRAEIGKGIAELDAGEGEVLDMAKIKARARKQLKRARRQ
jgi:antitoxin ParD1/3/4